MINPQENNQDVIPFITDTHEKMYKKMVEIRDHIKFFADYWESILNTPKLMYNLVGIQNISVLTNQGVLKKLSEAIEDHDRLTTRIELEYDTKFREDSKVHLHDLIIIWNKMDSFTTYVIEKYSTDTNTIYHLKHMLGDISAFAGEWSSLIELYIDKYRNN